MSFPRILNACLGFWAAASLPLSQGLLNRARISGVKATVSADGKFTATNTRNNFSKSYNSR
jgi:hypothetical protein